MDVVQCRLERWRTPGGPRCADGGTSHSHGLERRQPAMTTAHRQKTALITGASSGIGYELTQLFARAGYDLVLLARSQARLAQVADDLQHRYGVVVRVLAYDLAQLTKLLLPGMLQRHSGRILNVASTAAFQPGPLMAVYYATKAYVLSFSEALANELQGTGVTVSALCPGPTTSG